MQDSAQVCCVLFVWDRLGVTSTQIGIKGNEFCLRCCCGGFFFLGGSRGRGGQGLVLGVFVVVVAVRLLGCLLVLSYFVCGFLSSKFK